MSPSSDIRMPRPTDDAKEAFRSLVPSDGGVSLRPMFGNLAAFINGNLFSGLFGERLFVRLPESDRMKLLAAGGSDFEPMAGRPMRGYVMVPDGWLGDPQGVSGQIATALAFVSSMPAKAPKPKEG